MANKYVIAFLTLLVNAAGALTYFHAFKDGTTGSIVCGVTGMVALNMLAFLGQPLAQGKVAPAAPLTLVPPAPTDASQR